LSFEDNFPYKNLLLKGVPGTGKSSRELDLIINEQMFALPEERLMTHV
jgi:hypothetical protein